MSFSCSDVLVVLFPNADASPPKAGPVLVAQADAYNAKIMKLMVAAITSNLRHGFDPASLLIDVSTQTERRRKFSPKRSIIRTRPKSETCNRPDGMALALYTGDGRFDELIEDRLADNEAEEFGSRQSGPLDK